MWLGTLAGRKDWVTFPVACTAPKWRGVYALRCGYCGLADSDGQVSPGRPHRYRYPVFAKSPVVQGGNG